MRTTQLEFRGRDNRIVGIVDTELTEEVVKATIMIYDGSYYTFRRTAGTRALVFYECAPPFMVKGASSKAANRTKRGFAWFDSLAAFVARGV